MIGAFPAPNGPPTTDEVHLWIAYTARADEIVRQRCLSILSRDERERCDHFRFEEDRQSFLLAHALLRATLSLHQPLPPETWRFTVDAHGKPHVEPELDAPALKIGLSHTKGLVACALSRDFEVGVDVENTNRSGIEDGIAKRYFSPLENAALEALPTSTFCERFYTYWTLKEAYVKARGMGFSIPPEQFWFELDGGAARIRFDSRVPDDPSRWQFAHFAPSAGYRLAVAIEKGTRPDAKLFAGEMVPMR